MSKLPMHVILDTREAMRAFKAFLIQQEGHDAIAQVILSEIVNRFYSFDRLHYELCEYCAEIEMHEYVDDDFGIIIPPSYADAVFELGSSIIEQIKRFRFLYDSDGYAEYEYTEPKADRFNDLLLTLL